MSSLQKSVKAQPSGHIQREQHKGSVGGDSNGTGNATLQRCVSRILVSSKATAGSSCEDSQRRKSPDTSLHQQRECQPKGNGPAAAVQHAAAPAPVLTPAGGAGCQVAAAVATEDTEAGDSRAVTGGQGTAAAVAMATDADAAMPRRSAIKPESASAEPAASPADPDGPAGAQSAGSRPTRAARMGAGRAAGAAGTHVGPAQPGGTVGGQGGRSWPLGVSRVCPNGRWPVRVYLPLDAQGQLAAGTAVSVARPGSAGEAAVARDLALMWRQLALGQALGAGREVYNYTMARLKQEKSLLTQIQACARLDALLALLGQLEASGKLRQLATALAPAATDPGAAAAALATADGAAVEPQAKRRRVRGGLRPEAAGEASAAQGPSREPGESGAARGGGGGPVEGQAAVGRCVRVWQAIDDAPEQVFQGVVAEYTRTGLHHVVYDDGEEGLLDLQQAQFEFIGPPLQHPQQQDEQAAAAAAADVGQRLEVWWPVEGGGEAWYAGEVTHVLRSGMYCVRYDSDGGELLLDPSDPQQHAWVRWHSPPRQQRHMQQQQQQRRAEPRQGEPGQSCSQQQQQQQQQEQQQQEQQQQEQSHAQPGAAPAAPADGLFELLRGALAVDSSSAAAAGFTEVRVGRFTVVAGRMTPEELAAKERRLRVLLKAGHYRGAAALLQTTVELAHGSGGSGT